MTSLCLTVKNEDVYKIIGGIVRQTRLPDEIIIIDASPDFGRQKLKKEVQDKLNITYRHFDCSRGAGRNLAAKLAKSENLIFIDAGCELDRLFIEEMASSLEGIKSGIVAGRYVSEPDNFSQYIFEKFLNTDLRNKHSIYPSGRNFGIKKNVIFKLNGFREDLLTSAEDTEFFKRAAKKHVRFLKNINAIVKWRLPNKIDFFKKIYHYSKGDAESDIWWDPVKKLQTHNIKHIFLFGRFIILAFLLLMGFKGLSALLVLIYLCFSAVKNKIDFFIFSKNNVFKIVKNIFVYAIIKILTDIAIVTGFISGLFS